MAAVALHHAPAAEVDFRMRYQLSFRTFLTESGWNRAWQLIRPLISDPYSHLVASLVGRIRPAYPEEEMAVWQMEVIAGMLRQKGTIAPKPIKRPWHELEQIEAPRVSEGQKERRNALADRLGVKRPYE